MKKYDAIIIGFGKGGKTLASELSRHGWQVAMVERSAQMYGGTCINIGCIPTKTLVHQAKLACEQELSGWENKKAFYRRAIQTKEEVVSLLRGRNYHKLADDPNVTVYTGEGSFTGPDEVAVKTPDEVIKLKSEHIFINTGVETLMPPIPGIDGRRVKTSTTIMELTELPRRLVIIGGGYIGLEFASIYASFGSEVTVLEGVPELIPREDRDVAASVKETLEKKGITFRLGAQVQSIRDGEDNAVVSFRDTAANRSFDIDADAVLVAVGRRPDTSGLNLEAAGVEINGRGEMVVDELLKTTNPNIRAMGDVKGGLQFTYVSLDDYRIIREDLFGNHDRKTTDRQPVPYSVFIDPPLSRVGMSEEEARKNGYDVRVNKIIVASIPRVQTTGETRGMMKAVIDAKTDKILGCTLFCLDSHEIINTVSLAIKTGLKARVLRDFIYTHPTMSETFNDLFV